MPVFYSPTRPFGEFRPGEREFNRKLALSERFGDLAGERLKLDTRRVDLGASNQTFQQGLQTAREGRTQNVFDAGVARREPVADVTTRRATEQQNRVRRGNVADANLASINQSIAQKQTEINEFGANATNRAALRKLEVDRGNAELARTRALTAQIGKPDQAAVDANALELAIRRHEATEAGVTVPGGVAPTQQQTRRAAATRAAADPVLQQQVTEFETAALDIADDFPLGFGVERRLRGADAATDRLLLHQAPQFRELLAQSVEQGELSGRPAPDVIDELIRKGIPRKVAESVGGNKKFQERYRIALLKMLQAAKIPGGLVNVGGGFGGGGAAVSGTTGNF